jgi:hypothetical protein
MENPSPENKSKQQSLIKKTRYQVSFYRKQGSIKTLGENPQAPHDLYFKFHTFLVSSLLTKHTWSVANGARRSGGLGVFFFRFYLLVFTIFLLLVSCWLGVELGCG